MGAKNTGIADKSVSLILNDEQLRIILELISEERGRVTEAIKKDKNWRHPAREIYETGGLTQLNTAMSKGRNILKGKNVETVTVNIRKQDVNGLATILVIEMLTIKRVLYLIEGDREVGIHGTYIDDDENENRTRLGALKKVVEQIMSEDEIEEMSHGTHELIFEGTDVRAGAKIIDYSVTWNEARAMFLALLAGNSSNETSQPDDFEMVDILDSMCNRLCVLSETLPNDDISEGTVKIRTTELSYVILVIVYYYLFLNRQVELGKHNLSKEQKESAEFMFKHLDSVGDKLIGEIRLSDSTICRSEDKNKIRTCLEVLNELETDDIDYITDSGDVEIDAPAKVTRQLVEKYVNGKK